MMNATLITDRGRAAWGWLDARLNYFTQWRGDGELSMEGVQAIAELSIVFVRLTGPGRVWDYLCEDPEAEKRWHLHFVRNLTLPAVAELPRKRPIQAFPYILPYLVMRSTGWRDPFYERTLELLASRGLPGAQEVVPFRELDVAYFFNKAGSTGERDLYEMYRRTFLARMGNLIYIDHDAAYSITHTLLYLSDFGAAPLALPPDERAKARDVIETLLIHYWRIQHWDLLGELLLCAAIVGPSEFSLFPRALDVFFGAHCEDGSVAGRAALETELQEARDKDDAAGLFSGYYHTTIVSLLLANQLLGVTNE